ncbi:MAG: hypothetical protein IPJ68_01815 [Candidatus Moraniibacteriota bacterium]|nr:MAG: hypothetical protein IPJ68_01815 [Candidatus Moranbacteria bacterium]
MLSNRPIIALILLFAVALIGYFGFSSIMDAVLVEGASVFVAPAAWFFIILTLFSVGALVWHERMYQTAASIVLVISSFFFAPTLAHAGVSVVAGLCVFAGLLHIRRELTARIRLSLYRSVAVGVAPIILALSLVISSQYYTHVSTLSWDRLVPSFDLAEGSGAWLLRLAGTLSPSLAALQDRNLSVDEFLRDLKPAVEVGGPEETISNGIGEAVRQAEVIRSKLELSRLLGRSVNGDESMNALLSEALRKKTVAFVSGDAVGNTKAVPFLPFFLAILLFFTIYPILSLLIPLVLSLATVIFATLVRSGLIVVKKVPAEQEVIV